MRSTLRTGHHGDMTTLEPHRRPTRTTSPTRPRRSSVTTPRRTRRCWPGLRARAPAWHADDLHRHRPAGRGGRRRSSGLRRPTGYEPELRTHDRFGNRIDEVDFHPCLAPAARRRRVRGSRRRAVGGSRPGRPRGPGRVVLCLGPGRGRARLPGLDDVRRRARPAGQRRPCRGVRAVADQPGLRAGAAATVGKRGPARRHGHDREAGRLRRPRQHHRRPRPTATAPGRCAGTSGSPARRCATCSSCWRRRRRDCRASWCRGCCPTAPATPFRIQRLKDKLGNRCNASSEPEFDGTVAWLVGDEGRGVSTIIEMVSMTRLDCVIGSASLMRQALVQAAHHAAHRSAFGGLLIEKPLMRNVLADLSVESEAATTLMMRLAGAIDRAQARRCPGAGVQAPRGGRREVLGDQARSQRRGGGP